MSMLELDRFEARGDAGGPIGVTGEEDVLGQFAWTESDVVLPFSGWDRDPAIRGAFDAGDPRSARPIPRSGGCFAGAKLGRG